MHSSSRFIRALLVFALVCSSTGAAAGRRPATPEQLNQIGYEIARAYNAQDTDALMGLVDLEYGQTAETGVCRRAIPRHGAR
jgi:hypothetical protein